MSVSWRRPEGAVFDGMPDTPTTAFSTSLPRQPTWTLTETARFWSYWATRQDRYVDYFSYQVGRGVVEVADQLGVLRGAVLDYGCGPGFLLEHLLDRNLEVYGFELSDTYREVVERRAGGRRAWRGLRTGTGFPTPFDEGQFDLIFCLETLEHLTDEFLPPVLGELYRLCKPGGSVLVSTPHAEHLPHGFIYCPFCDSEFHKVQHQRSFTADAMRAVLTAHAFEVTFCESLELERFQERYTITPLRSMRPRRVLDWARYRSARALDLLGGGAAASSQTFRFLARPGNNLVAIARRPARTP
jgi:2-polyprenyl-3-methyl-5-hydroxy-6-metoxy-1,4-benzoquinol methylase